MQADCQWEGGRSVEISLLGLPFSKDTISTVLVNNGTEGKHFHLKKFSLGKRQFVLRSMQMVSMHLTRSFYKESCVSVRMELKVELFDLNKFANVNAVQGKGHIKREVTRADF